jgi:hypothetical protein
MWDLLPPGARSGGGLACMAAAALSSESRRWTRCAHDARACVSRGFGMGGSDGTWAAVSGRGAAWEERKWVGPKKTAQSSNYSNIFKMTTVDSIK